ncbi:MAG: PstS family phosphate ABC transporter substrate-binding protein, partial [Pirellulaceae bacterium]
MCSFGPKGYAPWRMLAVVFLLVVRVSQCQAQVEVDSQLPDYRFDATGISGQIKTVGSDTMNNMMLLWTERFKEGYRSVRAEVEGAGSSKAMPALLEGAASFGPMSRELKASETNEFEKKFGYKPVLLPTSIDLLAVV